MLCFCLFMGSLAKAQIINIDKLDTMAYQYKVKWDGNISAGLEIDKQNKTLYDASNFLDLCLKKKKTLCILSASNRFTYNGTQDFLNTGYFHLRMRNHYMATVHPESYIQYQWDEKNGIKRRFLVGENVRYNYWHKRDWEITFATGLMYETELWDYVGVDSSKIPKNAQNVFTSVLKSNSYIKWEGKTSATSTIKLAIFYQALFTSFFKPRVSSVATFKINASKHFGIGLSFISLYDVTPIVPINRFYYSFSNSIVYKL